MGNLLSGYVRKLNTGIPGCCDCYWKVWKKQEGPSSTGLSPDLAPLDDKVTWFLQGPLSAQIQEILKGDTLSLWIPSSSLLVPFFLFFANTPHKIDMSYFMV